MAPAPCTRAPQLHYVHSALVHIPDPTGRARGAQAACQKASGKTCLTRTVAPLGHSCWHEWRSRSSRRRRRRRRRPSTRSTRTRWTRRSPTDLSAPRDPPAPTPILTPPPNRMRQQQRRLTRIIPTRTRRRRTRRRTWCTPRCRRSPSPWRRSYSRRGCPTRRQQLPSASANTQSSDQNLWPTRRIVRSPAPPTCARPDLSATAQSLPSWLSG